MRNSGRPGRVAKVPSWLDISPGKHGGIEVQVQFKSTDRNADTHCCVCGQGFELLWEGQPRLESSEFFFEIQKRLCNHHKNDRDRQAHPRSGFLFPERKLTGSPVLVNFGQPQTFRI
jgi:hypothetical protein